MIWCNDPFARDFYQLLTCFEHQNQKVYFDSCAHAFAFNNFCYDYNDSCNFWNICGSLEESGAIENVTVSPNPAYDIVNLEMNVSRNITAVMVISDFTGKCIRKEEMELMAGENSETLDVSKLAKGIYLLEIRSDSGSRQGKIVKT